MEITVEFCCEGLLTFIFKTMNNDNSIRKYPDDIHNKLAIIDDGSFLKELAYCPYCGKKIEKQAY